MTHEEIDATSNVIEGTLFVCGFDAKVLFDPGSTRSFIAPASALHFSKDNETLPYDLIVVTPVSRSVPCNVVYFSCSVQIGEVQLTASLIILPMSEFDLLLGMNWLAAS